MKCPTFERLIDFLDGRLETSAAVEVATHLDSGCGSCSSDRDWYQAVKRIAASDESVEPPSWVFKRALRIFEEAGRTRTTRVSRAGRLIAALLFDSASQPAMAEARSSGADARQLLYRAGEYSVDMQVMGVDENRLDVTGQILREGEFLFESVGGLSLHLVDAAGGDHLRVTSDRGEFSINGIEPGTYHLRIDVRGSRVTIENLNLKHRL